MLLGLLVIQLEDKKVDVSLCNTMDVGLREPLLLHYMMVFLDACQLKMSPQDGLAIKILLL